jgi:NADH-quinone oxidoreductase subunit L
MDTDLVFKLILLAPLLGAILNGIGVRFWGGKVAGPIGTAAVFISFICGLFLFSNLSAMPPESREISLKLWNWINFGDLQIPFSFSIDAISIIMLLVITGVGSLIHLFSIGYMSHDPGVTKYFSYLNLFVFNMLILVLGDSLPLMFVGWEGVGLCSYLLIGFWFSDRAKAEAGMKAFVVNRIGDAAFLLGMFILFFHFGSLDMQTLNAMVKEGPSAFVGLNNPVTIGTLLLFIGATGKSAQIPLYVWLPDAMAGPTPVSALIHAATMVTAGVYLIVRLNPLFAAAPLTLDVVTIVGLSTALMAATIGLCQWDIKKILAYSTVSQLGFMFIACGVGAFGAAMFHLVTHAFFKALMFLGSGSVIHGMHEEQDIRKMGGLKKYMPWTHLTFVLGWLAILGIPPFSGFFSKDEILWSALAGPRGQTWIWMIVVVSALVTAFYMTRLMAVCFWGTSRVSKDVHPHESGIVMLLPLFILGILSVVGGWVGIPHVIGELLPWHPQNHWSHWLSALVPEPKFAAEKVSIELPVMVGTLSLVIVSAGLAFYFYKIKTEIPGKIASAIQPLYHLVSNKYFVDEAYQRSVVNPIVQFSKNAWYFFDVQFIDKITYWVSDLVRNVSTLASRMQNGNLQRYAFYFAISLVFILLLALSR